MDSWPSANSFQPGAASFTSSFTSTFAHELDRRHVASAAADRAKRDREQTQKHRRRLAALQLLQCLGQAFNLVQQLLALHQSGQTSSMQRANRQGAQACSAPHIVDAPSTACMLPQSVLLMVGATSAMRARRWMLAANKEFRLNALPVLSGYLQATCADLAVLAFFWHQTSIHASWQCSPALASLSLTAQAWWHSVPFRRCCLLPPALSSLMLAWQC